MAAPDAGGRARTCTTCGALNGSDFDRCIRCGAALSSMAASADGLRTRIDGRALLGTKVLIGLTLLIFAGQTMAALAAGNSVGFISSGDSVAAIRFGALPVAGDIVAMEPWRLLTAVFVHFGVLHVGLNLFGLFNLARVAEPGVGSARFVIAYVLTGIASFATTVAYTLLAGGRPSLTAGASGAVFGVMGLILGVLVRRRDPRWKQFAGQAVGYALFFGFAMNTGGTGILVNNSAHLGGLVAGFGFGLFFGNPRPQRTSDLAVNIGAGLAIAACAASLLMAQASPLWRSL